MATDWAAHIKEHVPNADDEAIAGIIRHCGISLHKVDSSLVSFGDPTELARVRDGFMKKKLALTDADEELDAVLAKIGEKLKGASRKYRPTVYYMLADHYGKLDLFKKSK